MNFTFSFSTLFQNMASSILGFFGPLELAGYNMIAAILAVVSAALTLQVMWQGYGVIRGQGAHVLDVFFKSIRPALVLGLCLGAVAPTSSDSSYYQTNIIGFFVGSLDPTANNPSSGSLQDTITHAFSPNAPTANPFQNLDTAMGNGINATTAIEEAGVNYLLPHLYWIGVDWDPGHGIILILLGGIFGLIVIILCVLSFADLLVNYVALKIIFGVGPLFIACYGFEATAQYFQTWLSAVLKWMFANVVLIIMVNIAVSILSAVSTQVTNDSGGDYTTLLTTVLGGVGAMIALMILNGKASVLGGDLAGAGAGVTGMAQSVGGRVGSSFQSMVNRVTSAAKGGGQGQAGGASGAGAAANGAKAGAAARGGQGNSLGAAYLKNQRI